MLVDLADLSTSAVYHLLTQVVVPRPVAWVVSDNGPVGAGAADGSGDERWNLAPFSYFNAVASDPPTVMFSMTASRREVTTRPGIKDTLANVSERPDHTIALPGRAQLAAVEATSAEVPPGTSELALAGLEAVAWDWPVPRPSGVRAALGCTVDRIVPVTGGPQRIVLARVHRVWVDDTVIGEDAKGRMRVDPERLDPLVRLGAGEYAALGAVVRPERSGHLGG